ncbi:lysine--tRNA ligase [Tengunoibacter tsumagoiensis]|uniref:Lysine--tRNA ligase n=1 Tax=Tengunoibacter tsumagoiensis TaxID=2014871 RepID=A0A402A3I0_9CHLR|nr:lysine--tRNA ligase [Tengunoibacter tsumagoiensis]GCE13707.1 lysine--tRNA ligase [Tengunoibacter tsumagoiensis]
MKADWVTKIADRVEENVRQNKGENATVVCASGISPSGPIHLGNLREIMTVHLVAEELRSRGWTVDHIHSWDDYDRLRKVPKGVSEEYAQYIGSPYSDIPDPFGEYDSYATRYISDLVDSLTKLGIHPRYIRQSEAYRRGDYVEQIKQAMRNRLDIFDTLAEYQNLEGQKQTLEERRNAYYPFKVYCDQCHKDITRVTAYEDETARITYTCDNCGHNDSYSLYDKVEGKLVWKVDWPMRWSFEKVDFEPGGEDHSSPGSSYTVGQRIVKEVYGWQAPYFVGYAFVGMGGRSKISSSAGTSATVSSALAIIEPAILRWLYARRANNQAFDIDYGQGLLRLYEEWDGLVRQINKGVASEVNAKLFERATHTVSEEISYAKNTIPFPVLTSVLDVTQANEEQLLRIASQQLNAAEGQDVTREQLEPRFTCALNWVTNYLPDDERTHINSEFNDEAFANFNAEDQASIQMLAERLESSWNLAAITELMYSIPKIVRGLPVDAAPTNELKQAQRSFFIAIYMLICGTDTGPRIPTLLLSIGKERARLLLTPSRNGDNGQSAYELTAH